MDHQTPESLALLPSSTFLPEPRDDLPTPHPVPEFLRPKDPLALNTGTLPAARKANLELATVQFEVVFPTMLDKLCGGMTLTQIMREHHSDLDVGMFVRWIKRDKERARLYDEAQEHRTEIWADKIVEYAEGTVAGSAMPEDVQRSKLKVGTLRFLMSAANRKKFGSHVDVEADVETTITINAPWMNPNRLSYADQVIEDVTPRLMEE